MTSTRHDENVITPGDPDEVEVDGPVQQDGIPPLSVVGGDGPVQQDDEGGAEGTAPSR